MTHASQDDLLKPLSLCSSQLAALSSYLTCETTLPLHDP
jgi:hypothetical protein